MRRNFKIKKTKTMNPYENLYNALEKEAGLSSARSNINKSMHNSIRFGNKMLKTNKSNADVAYGLSKNMINRTKKGTATFIKNHKGLTNKLDSFKRIENTGETFGNKMEKHLGLPSKENRAAVDGKVKQLFEKKYKMEMN